MAFKKLARCGRDCAPQNGQLELLELMYKNTEVPAQIINSVVERVTAASDTEVSVDTRARIVQLLGNDCRLVPDVRNKALDWVTDKGCISILRAWSKERQMLSEEACRGLLRAASAGHLDIVKFVLGRPGISTTVLREATIAGARNNHNGVTLRLCKHQQWPLDVLQGALNVTRNKRLKNSCTRDFCTSGKLSLNTAEDEVEEDRYYGNDSDRELLILPNLLGEFSRKRLLMG